MRVGANSSEGGQVAVSGEALAEGIASALPGWVVLMVEERMVGWAGWVPLGVADAARRAGAAAAADVGSQVGSLLAQDVDDQATNPLSVVRRAVRYPTEVLREAGVPEVVRDDFAERSFPDDVYDLSPSSFADLDPGLADLGLRWGAAKAMVVLRRRGAEGRR